MTGELLSSNTGSSTPPSVKSGLEAQTEQRQTELAEILGQSFKRLPHLYSQTLTGRFDTGFPYTTLPFRLKKQDPHFDMDPIVEVKKQDRSDCVGAAFMSVVGSITGVPVSSEVYQTVLTSAVQNKLAEVEENRGIKVLPFIFNALMTGGFTNRFGDVTVASRDRLRISDLLRTARDARSKGFGLFIALPVTSEKNPGGGHIVILQKIQGDVVRIYDPEGTEKELSAQDFSQRWKYADNNAIFIFTKTPKKAS